MERAAEDVTDVMAASIVVEQRVQDALLTYGAQAQGGISKVFNIPTQACTLDPATMWTEPAPEFPELAAVHRELVGAKTSIRDKALPAFRNRHADAGCDLDAEFSREWHAHTGEPASVRVQSCRQLHLSTAHDEWHVCVL